MASVPPNPPQSVIELTFGPLVAGIWIQQLLLGFIIAQMVDYYRLHFASDDIFNKIIVSLLLFFNVFLGAVDFHVLYRSAVLHYGVYEFFDLQEWTMWTEPMWTAVVGFIAQIFFLARVYKMSKSWIVTGILALLVLFAFGSGLSVSASFIIDKRFSSLGQFTLPIELWLLSTSAVDIAIAGVLIFYLVKSRTEFYKTNSVLTKLIIMTMETSALTAIVAVLNLVLFLPLQNTAYHLLPQFSMSRVYTLTVMVTLLARPQFRDALGNKTYKSFSTTFRTESFHEVATTDRQPIRVGVSTSVENDNEANRNLAKGPPFLDDIELNAHHEPLSSHWPDRKTATLP